MINLIEAMQTVGKLETEKRTEFNREIAKYENAFALLKQLNEACLACNGKGKILKTRACAEDDRPDPNDPSDWRVCPACNGTGYEKKE